MYSLARYKTLISGGVIRPKNEKRELSIIIITQGLSNYPQFVAGADVVSTTTVVPHPAQKVKVKCNTMSTRFPVRSPFVRPP